MLDVDLEHLGAWPSSLSPRVTLGKSPAWPQWVSGSSTVTRGAEIESVILEVSFQLQYSVVLF